MVWPHLARVQSRDPQLPKELLGQPEGEQAIIAMHREARARDRSSGVCQAGRQAGREVGRQAVD